MKKRIFSFFLILCLLGSMLPQLIPGTSAATIGDLSDSISWDLDTSTGLLTITGSGPMPNWTDSGEASPWYDQRTSIRSLVISSGITTIGSNAFKGCTYLSSVVLPDGLTTIGASAFYACTLSSSFTIPSSVSAIGDYAFYGSRLTSVTIPSGVRAIGDYTFYGCNRLSSVKIPDSVETIGTHAFYGCERLLSMTIPNGVSSIGNYAFHGCTRLSSVSLPNSLSTIGESAFRRCTALTSVTIPNKVAVLSDSVFRGCTGLESVSIPESVTYIDRCAFYECAALTSVTIPDSVKTIDYRAFHGCVGLESIHILNSTCEIYDEKETLSLSENGNIYGYANSTTEAFALKYGYPFTPLTSNPELDESIVIYHALNLTSDIAILYAVKATNLVEYESYYMECVLPIYEGNKLVGTEVVTLQPELRGEYYYFVLDGLFSFEMNDMVETTLHMAKNGKEYISDSHKYSIATYAYAQLNNASAPDELKAVCANLLRYGAKAQLWKSYRTDTLVDANMTDAHKAYLKDLDSVEFGSSNHILTDIENPVITWVGKTMSLESKIIVRFVMNTTNYTGDLSKLSLRISFVDINGETKTVTLTEHKVYNAERNFYAFDFDGLLSTEMRCVLNAAVYEGDTQLSPTMVYSIDTYGASTTGALRTLVQAMVAYGDSAYTFFTR